MDTIEGLIEDIRITELVALGSPYTNEVEMLDYLIDLALLTLTRPYTTVCYHFTD